MDWAPGAETPKLQNPLPSLSLSSQNARGLVEPLSLLPQTPHSSPGPACCPHLSSRDSGPPGMNAWRGFLPSALGLLNQLHLALRSFFGQFQKPSPGLGSSYTGTLGPAGTAERPASAPPRGLDGVGWWFPWRGRGPEDSWPLGPLPSPGTSIIGVSVSP